MILPDKKVLKYKSAFELILVTFSVFFFLYFYSFTLNYFFLQDDYFHLAISKATSIGDLLAFFYLRAETIAYRPITIQFYFFSLQNLFGLNPFLFRLTNIFLVLISFVLIIKLASIFTKNNLAGVITGCFWLTASFHFMAISWISASYNIVGTTFYLLTTLLFLKHLESNSKLFYLASIIFFLLTIGSFEFSVTWPALFAFYSYFFLKIRFKTIFVKLLPILLISLVFSMVKLFITKIPDIPDYQFAANIDSAKALFWYILWGLNVPDEFKYQTSNFLVLQNSRFLSEFWPLVFKSYSSLLWLLVLGLGIPLYRYHKKEINLELKLIAFGIIFFTIAISPVLLLPNHSNTMYLTLASVGIYLPIGYLLAKNNSKILILCTLAIWLVFSQTTLNFYKISSWIAYSQQISKTIIFNAFAHYPSLPKGSTVYYPLVFKRDQQALSGENAFKVFYQDQDLRVYYFYSDLSEDFKRGKLKEEIYIIGPN